MGTSSDHGGWPSGVVAMLLADLEGSTPLWESDPESMDLVTREVDDLVDRAAVEHGGRRSREQGEGDSFVIAFERASDAVVCAHALRGEIGSHEWPGDASIGFRMGLHVGDVLVRGGVYSGAMLARCARVRDLGGGGQILMTAALRELSVDALPEGTSLWDHGEHELRGLSRAERVYELCDVGAEPRPLRTIVGPAPSLPTEHTSLVGRERELAEINELLHRHRLVSLVGAGGSGKSRLAIRVGHEAGASVGQGSWQHDAPTHETWWVELAPVRDGQHVVGEIVRAAGAGVTMSLRSVDELVEAVADRPLLVILDNCEHLLEATTEVTAALVERCPGVRVLTTSREPLGLAAEQVMKVPSLSVPRPGDDLSAVAGTGAAKLFVERGRRVRPGFELDVENADIVAEICRRLDGLPLAIELAAARLRVLAPRQILDGLSERFRLLTGGPRTALARQRTLEGSVLWSVDLLDDDERLVLHRLGVFAGSFDLRAAEAVCATGNLDHWAVLDVIERLVDRSLVQADHTGLTASYSLLETIRAFVRQGLAAVDDVDQLRERHLEHYRRRVCDLEPAFQGDGANDAFSELDAVIQEVRAALERAASTDRVDAAIDILQAGLGYWEARGHSREMFDRLEHIARKPSTSDTERARVLALGSRVGWIAARTTRADEMAREAVQLAKTAGDPELLCEALGGRLLGACMTLVGDADELMDAAGEATDLAEQVGSSLLKWRTAIATRQLANILWVRHPFATIPSSVVCGVPLEWTAGSDHGLLLWQGRLHDAVAAAQTALRVTEATAGEGFANAHMYLGMAERSRGNLDRARHHLSVAVDAHVQSGLTSRAGIEGVLFAEVHYREGDMAAAKRAATDALSWLVAEGVAVAVVMARLLLGWVELDAGDPDSAATHFEEARRLNALPWRYGLGQTDLGLAYVSARTGRPEQSWQLAHTALESFDPGRWLGNPIAVALTFELLAELAADRDLAELGGRLLGAADTYITGGGYARMPHEVLQRDQARQAVQAALGEDQLETASREGHGLSVTNAIALARRGRGTKNRPSKGWDSLTPAEADVSRLVAAGLTNREIADRLFVSVNTVKTHLRHAYSKLDLASRVELAAVAAHAESEPGGADNS